MISWRWPLVRRSTYERLQTENWSLKQHLVETQRELMKHRRLLIDLGNADEATEKAFARARDKS